MKVSVDRSSVCMGDDCNSHLTIIDVPHENVTFRQLMEAAVIQHYLPLVNDSDVVWVLKNKNNDFLAYYTLDEVYEGKLINDSISSRENYQTTYFFRYYSNVKDFKNSSLYLNVKKETTKAHIEDYGGKLMGLFDKIKEAGNDLVKNVTSEETKEKAKLFVGNVANKVDEAAKKVATEENKEKAKEFFSNAGAKIKETTDKVVSEENKEKAKEFFSNAGEKIKETASNVASEENKEKAKSFFDNVGAKLDEVATDISSKISKKEEE